MSRDGGTREQLTEELGRARQRIAELEAALASRDAGGVAQAGGLSISQLESGMTANMSEGAFLMRGRDGVIVYTNPKFSQIFGYEAGELVGKHVSCLNAPTDRSPQETAAEIMQMTAKAGVWRGEVNNQRKDGSAFWCQASVSTFEHPEHGEVWVAVHRDISARKRAEDALLEREREFRALFDHSPVALWHEDFSALTARLDELRRLGITDLRRYFDDNPDERQEMVRLVKVVDVNHRSVAMFGAQSKEHLIGSLSELLDGEALEVFTEEVIGMWEGIELFESETRSRTLDGRVIHFLVRVHLDKVNGEPDLSRAIVSMMDITERKRAAEERQRLEAKSRHAQKLESLGILAGGIAHDFNNILTGLLCNVGLLLADVSSQDPLRPMLEDVHRDGLRAAALTGQMLTYSGKGHFSVGDVDINALVQDLPNHFHSRVSARSGFRYELADGLPVVRGDVEQLRELALSLVTNASEALDGKPGLIQVRTYLSHRQAAEGGMSSSHDELAGGRYVTLEVSDPGCGMDEQTKGKLFEPFFSTKFTGRGLGLAAAQGIVRGHKGAILVESELGKGATFKVLIPVIEGASAASELPVTEKASAPPEPGSGDESAGRTANTILVVDDEEMVCRVAARTLKQLGYAVLTANDGVEAVALYRECQHEIACVLLDLNMPGMRGNEIYDKIVEIGGAVPVILSSGNGRRESTEQFGDKQLAGFLQKPYRVADLRQKLEEALGRAS